MAEDDQPTPLANSTNRELYSSRPIPTISVTKPPLPLPVNLPTEDDIVTPVDVENQAVMQDLEAGIGVMMDEIEHTSAAAHVTPPPVLSRSPSTGLREAATIPLPSSPTPREVGTSSPNPLTSPAANLLEDPAPTLPTPPIVPSISTTPQPEEKHEDDSPVLVSTDDVEEDLPQATVRIVGGAIGQPLPAGPTSEDLSSDGVLVASAHEEEPPSPPAETAAPKKHEKKSSISSNLKKIGNLGGGKRKKDSVSSVKEVA